MCIALASIWRPRGDQGRLSRLRGQLEAVYSHFVVVIPPQDDFVTAQATLGNWPTARVLASPEPFWGRYVSLREAIRAPVDHVHYADLDMLLHWVETRPDEWRDVVGMAASADCLITGRTEHAFASRPKAIQETEAIINTVFTHVLGQPVDLGLGSRGFSRRAVELILRNSQPGGWGDAEWPILVHRAGWKVRYVAADNVEWETPDFHREAVADEATRQRAAEEYDLHADRWASRVRVAQEIIAEGLAALERPPT